MGGAAVQSAPVPQTVLPPAHPLREVLYSVVGAVAATSISSLFGASPTGSMASAALGAAIPPAVTMVGPWRRLRLGAGVLIIAAALFVTYWGVTGFDSATGRETFPSPPQISPSSTDTPPSPDPVPPTPTIETESPFDLVAGTPQCTLEESGFSAKVVVPVTVVGGPFAESVLRAGGDRRPGRPRSASGPGGRARDYLPRPQQPRGAASPGVGVLATIDPDGVVPETDRANNALEAPCSTLTSRPGNGGTLRPRPAEGAMKRVH